MATRHAMRSVDAAWLHMDRPTNLMVINSLLWFDEPVDWRRCREVFHERIVERFDRFRQCAVEGVAGTGAHWEDVGELELDLHFHHVALPAPRATDTRSRSSSPTVRQPPWIARARCGRSTSSTVSARAQPCWCECTTASLTASRSREGDAHPRRRRRSARARLRQTWQRRLNARQARRCRRRAGARGPRDGAASPACAEAGRDGARGRSDAEQVAAARLGPRTAIKGDQHVAHRVAWSAPVELWRVKRAAKALNATLNECSLPRSPAR